MSNQPADIYEPDWSPMQQQVEALPPFPADGICPFCQGENWCVVEHGYSRFTQAAMEDGMLIASGDGWDDMSEGGAAEYMQCDIMHTGTGCGACFQTPEEMDWT